MKDNKVISKGLVMSGLRRYWPLWLALFVALILSLDAPIYSAAIEIAGRQDSMADRVESMRLLWYSVRMGSLVYALVASIIVAVAIDEHLFDSRAATFVGSIPIKRQTIFASQFVLGYVALLGVFGLAALLLVPLRIAIGSLFALRNIVFWYAMTALVTFVFYAFAQLSCHLAGSRAVAVLLYGVINFLSVCLEQAVRLVIASLQYGMSSYDFVSDKLSPAIWLGEAIQRGMDVQSKIEWISVGVYVLVAIGIAALTAALFVRRSFESAGESIAIPALRPILKYLSGVSMALLFSSVLCLLRMSNTAHEVPVGTFGAMAIACVMAVGSMLGVLFSEMIMRRSARVLKHCWRDGIVLACLSLAFVAVCWFDLLGVAHRVPAPADVQSVNISWDYSGEATLTSQEQIADVCSLHRELLAFDNWSDTESGTVILRLRYHLNNGHWLSREYPVMANYFPYIYDEESPNEGALIVEHFAHIADTVEGRASRFAQVLDVDTPSNIQVEYYADGDVGEYRTIEISPDDRTDFIEHALRPDLLEEPAGEISQTFVVADGDLLDATIMVFEGQANTGSEACILTENLGETTTPHILAWLSERYPDLKLMRQDGGYVLQ